MLDAGILTSKQCPGPTALAGTFLTLRNITVKQREAANPKRHGSSAL